MFAAVVITGTKVPIVHECLIALAEIREHLIHRAPPQVQRDRIRVKNCPVYTGQGLWVVPAQCCAEFRQVRPGCEARGQIAACDWQPVNGNVVQALCASRRVLA